MARPRRALKLLPPPPGPAVVLDAPGAWADGGVSVADACDLVGVGRTTLDACRLRGEFPWARVRAKVVIARRGLLDWLARQQVGA